METKHWLDVIDDVTKSIKEEFGGLTAEQLNWKPNSKVWSVGQCIDHLIVINSTYFPVVKQLKEGSYNLIWLGKFDFIVRFFGDFILKSVLPDRKGKIKTFPIWEPTTSAVSQDIISKFSNQQSLLKETIASCSNLLDQGTVISSPAKRMVVYKLERAFDIIVTHERRHLEQAREINQLRLSK